MEREVQEQFEKIWATLDRADKRTEKVEASFNRRMDRAEQRMEKFDRRMELGEHRGALADKRIEATRKLVEVGMKIVMRNSADIKAVNKRIDAFLRSTRNGHDCGNGHGPKRGR